MAIEKQSMKDRLDKLKERQKKIDAEADAKRKEVEAEIAKLRDDAKDEIMSTFDSGVETLKGFGHSVYEIASMFAARYGFQFGKAPKGAGKGASGIKRPPNLDQPCPICGFKTVPHHDGRKHRSQSEKKPFTASELTGLGLKKA